MLHPFHLREATFSTWRSALFEQVPELFYRLPISIHTCLLTVVGLEDSSAVLRKEAGKKGSSRWYDDIRQKDHEEAPKSKIE